MPDIPAPIPNGKAGPHSVVEVRLVLQSDGNVRVTGPLNDFRLMARILGQALQAAASFREERLVAPVPADAMRLLKP